jgi:hypothetical protein
MRSAEMLKDSRARCGDLSTFGLCSVQPNGIQEQVASPQTPIEPLNINL